MKKIAVVLLALSLLLGVASAESLTPVIVGATTSPHAEILELVSWMPTTSSTCLS